MEATSKDVTLSFNKARLLLGDDVDLIDYLRKCRIAFKNINDAVNGYINLGIPAKMIAIAWDTICQQNDIAREDYFALLKNPSLAEEFKKMCDNSYTQDIRNKIKIYTDLMEHDEFDEKFRKYIQIQELK